MVTNGLRAKENRLPKNQDPEAYSQEIGDLELRLVDSMTMFPTNELFFDGKFLPLQPTTVHIGMSETDPPHCNPRQHFLLVYASTDEGFVHLIRNDIGVDLFCVGKNMVSSSSSRAMVALLIVFFADCLEFLQRDQILLRIAAFVITVLVTKPIPDSSISQLLSIEFSRQSLKLITDSRSLTTEAVQFYKNIFGAEDGYHSNIMLIFVLGNRGQIVEVEAIFEEMKGERVLISTLLLLPAPTPTLDLLATPLVTLRVPIRRLTPTQIQSSRDSSLCYHWIELFWRQEKVGTTFDLWDSMVEKGFWSYILAVGMLFELLCDMGKLDESFLNAMVAGYAKIMIKIEHYGYAESIAWKACTDSQAVSVLSNIMKGSINNSKCGSGDGGQTVAEPWWIKDVSHLMIDHFTMVIKEIKRKGMRADSGNLEEAISVLVCWVDVETQLSIIDPLRAIIGGALLGC
ncbi:hypothetical protein NE237_012051 [Protea cynaroides]|uniref:Uncharacterized protein n=1 Tax=Protea cynaroides TaxID=273540 RepID=A0A9Q0GZ38_9MAGN|nr:hypothetical protein NE237_012051 [Protea cynaroides]